jgi:eukaryotic-like serine/threonine-protein kinase
MTPEHWARLQEILGAALEKSEAERRAFLDGACGANASLREEVERMLACESEAGGFLESPAVEVAARALAAASGSISPGSRLGPYEIVSLAGVGGMGEVWKAHDPRLNRFVALKVLPRELVADPERKHRFIREARAASALNHANIVTIHEIGQADGIDFIAMEYVEGASLAQLIPPQGLPLKRALEYATEIADGLAQAHNAGLVHRDLKPANIMVTTQGRVKLLDFGLARRLRLTSEENSTLSMSGQIAGTPAYMSPEQAQGKPLDTRTDLWSLGALLYEMITGRRAFAADDLPATLHAVMHTPPPELGDDVPGGLQKIIYRALAKKPEDRYQSAAEMMQDLRQVAAPEAQGGTPAATIEEIGNYLRLAASPSSAPKKRSRRRWLLVLPLVAVLAAGLWMWRKPAGPKPAAYETYLKARGYIQRYEKPENLDRAIVLLNNAVREDPNFTLAFASLGEAYTMKSRFTKDPSLLNEAESNARRALQLDDTLAQVHIVLGGVHGARGNRDLAQEEYQRALKLDPSNPGALFGLAGEYAARQRVQEAEQLYRRAAALRPDSWEGYNNLGIFLKAQKRPQEAAQQFRRVVELTPDNVAGHLNLAASLIDEGKFDEAEAPLERASQLAPSSYAVHVNLGHVYCRRGRFAEAERATRRALDLSGKHWITWVNLAIICRWMNQDGRAVEAYRRAVPLLEESVRVQPKQAVPRAVLAEVYAYIGQSDKSLSSIGASLALDPENAAVLLSCANAYAALGDRSVAVAMANKAVANGLTSAALNSDPETRRFRAEPGFKAPNR